MKYEFTNFSDGSRARYVVGTHTGKSLVRENYRVHRRDIKDSHDLRASLRAGRYTSLGTYPIFFITCEADTLCFDCVAANYRQVSSAIRYPWSDRGFQVAHLDVNYESDLQCAECSKQIESAYGVASDESDSGE
jgi:hypothetical protein